MNLLEPGQRVGSTYEVERFLGEGAFAEVYRVKHRFLGRQAMKLLKAPGMDISNVEKMLTEAVILSRLGHPNIVRVFNADVIELHGETYGFFTMEYIAGGSLEQFWRSFGTRYMPVGTAVEIARQICRGLAVAHTEKPPIVHRDIKPQNALVGYEGDGLRVRISDFGLAKRANPLTLLVSARGTLPFKAPEAFKDYQGDSCAGDVWAVGVTMYLLLTDKYPFDIPEDIGTMNPRCFDKAVVLPSRFNVFVDSKLDNIVLRAVSPDPKGRYQTSVELLRDLETWRPDAGLPRSTLPSRQSGSTSKTALGPHSPAEEQGARSKVKEAIRLARETGRLNEAADLLEEALNKGPDLRPEYESQVKLWRKGILM